MNKEKKYSKLRSTVLACTGLLIFAVGYSMKAKALSTDDIKTFLKNPSETSEIKCGAVKVFQFQEGVLKVRPVYRTVRSIYEGYRATDQDHTVAYEVQVAGKKVTGVLDFYGVDEKNPIEIKTWKQYLEIKHKYGTHDIPLELMFSGKADKFGFEATPFYQEATPCIDQMP